MLLAESFLLSGLGGAGAAVLSLWATGLLSYGLSLVQEGLRWNAWFRNWDLTPDSRVFAGTFLVSLLVGVFCGLTPALQASKTDLTSAMKDEARLPGSGLARFSWRNTLVAAQVAGAVVLIAASGLFLRSARQAWRFESGFEARQLAFTRMEFPRKPDAMLTRVQVYRDLEARVAALPEVQAVSVSDEALLEGTGYREGHKLQVPGDDRMPFGERVIGSVTVGTDYFKTIGLPLALGRDFTERDRVVSSRVVIVNEALAQRAFPGENPVGRDVRLLPRLSRGNVEQWKSSAS
jgi:MacB-like periplasmic core domain